MKEREFLCLLAKLLNIPTNINFGDMEDHIVGRVKEVIRNDKLSKAEMEKVEKMYTIVVSNYKNSCQVRMALEQENASLRSQLINRG